MTLTGKRKHAQTVFGAQKTSSVQFLVFLGAFAKPLILALTQTGIITAGTI